MVWINLRVTYILEVSLFWFCTMAGADVDLWKKGRYQLCENPNVASNEVNQEQIEQNEEILAGYSVTPLPAVQSHFSVAPIPTVQSCFTHLVLPGTLENNNAKPSPIDGLDVGLFNTKI